MMVAMLRSLILLSAVALLIGAPAAHAHSATLESMNPPDGATISGSTASGHLTYSEPVTIEALVIELPDGQVVEPVSRTRGAVTDFALPRPITPGAATITWKVPQADGHDIEYEKTYVYDESALDGRVALWRGLIDDGLAALRGALAAWR